MYKIIVKENMMGEVNYYEKEAATLEEIKEMYAGLFPLVINLIVEYLRVLIDGNKEMEPVFLQIINALQGVEVNEPIVFNATDAPFFTGDENFLDFQLAGKFYSVKVEEC